ncbi:hypothetical protein BH09VER1_BH09VER1_28220 [soil metagenome]
MYSPFPIRSASDLHPMPASEENPQPKTPTPSALAGKLRAAQAHLTDRQLPQAQAAFLKLIQLDPQNPAAHLGLAQAHLAQRHSTEAIDSAHAALALQPSNPAAHYILGIALHRIGQVDPAIAALTTCLQHHPHHQPALRRLILISEKRQRDPQKAAQYKAQLAAAEQNQPTNPT